MHTERVFAGPWEMGRAATKTINDNEDYNHYNSQIKVKEKQKSNKHIRGATVVAEGAFLNTSGGSSFLRGGNGMPGRR